MLRGRGRRSRNVVSGAALLGCLPSCCHLKLVLAVATDGLLSGADE